VKKGGEKKYKCGISGVRKKKNWKEGTGEKKSKCFSGRGLCLTHVGAPCCKTWLEEGIAEVGITIAKKI
jgi:hypothetical protein